MVQIIWRGASFDSSVTSTRRKAHSQLVLKSESPLPVLYVATRVISLVVVAPFIRTSDTHRRQQAAGPLS